jgi:hypothetical protein
VYNDHGLPARQISPVATTAAPPAYTGTGVGADPGTIFSANATQTPSLPVETITVYDAANRPTAIQTYAAGVFQFQTMTAYDGWRTTTYPTATSLNTTLVSTYSQLSPKRSTVDAFGRQVKLDGSSGVTPITTSYTYDKLDNQPK